MSDVDIHREIRNNAHQLEKVVEILKAKGNSNLAKAKDGAGNLPLHEAMKVGNLPLHEAMKVGKKGVFDLAQVLVKMNPEGVRTKNGDGNLPIHFLGPETDDGNKAIKLLLKEYPEGSKIKNKAGELPIHFAAVMGFVVAAKLLLKEYPEGIKVKDNDGSLPIHFACSHGRSTIRLFVDEYPEGLQHKNTAGNLPIHKALDAFRGRLADIGEYDFLIDSYPDCLKVENNDEQLPLHRAVSAGSIRVAELICRRYPIATHMPDRFGKSPVDVAVAQEGYPMFKMLARICPDALDMRPNCHVRIMQLLKKSNVAKRRREQISGLLWLSEKRNSMNTDQIAELETKLAMMKAGKEHAQIALAEHTKKYEEQKRLQEASDKRYEAALTADNKKYEERLEQEKQQIASLKERVEHSEKRIQSYEVARKSESKLLSRLLQTSDDWAVADLKSIAKSLNTRLDALKTQFQGGSRRSMAQNFLPYLLNEADPSKEYLLQSIETIDSELTEAESTVASLSTSDDIVNPEATRVLDERPENEPRKRARVSISPA